MDALERLKEITGHSYNGFFAQSQLEEIGSYLTSDESPELMVTFRDVSQDGTDIGGYRPQVLATDRRIIIVVVSRKKITGVPDLSFKSFGYSEIEAISETDNRAFNVRLNNGSVFLLRQLIGGSKWPNKLRNLLISYSNGPTR